MLKLGSVQQFYRLRRFGEPVVVVSGLPRSGTSMMMRMLHAGGMPTLTDESRGADESNPHGYFEFSPTKDAGAGADLRWLDEAKGKAVKLVSPLLEHLPSRYNYRVIFMQRDLREVIASQNVMLARRGEAASTMTEAELLAAYETHLRVVRRLIAGRPGMSSTEVNYADALDHPLAQARRIIAFLGRPLDEAAMAGAVDPSLYRNRRG
jgi:hypothetical protein